MATFNELQQVYLEYTHNLLPGTIGLSFPDFCTGYNVFTEQPAFPALHRANEEQAATNYRKIPVDVEQLKDYLACDFKIRGISVLMQISEPTLKRRIKEYGLSIRGSYSNISDNDLDIVIANVLKRFPKFGLQLLQGKLVADGYKLQEKRLRASYARIGLKKAKPGLKQIPHVVYHADSPLQMWHMDGFHKFDGWGFVVHGIVDGYSKAIVGMQVSDNNRSETVVKLLHSSCIIWGTPACLRTDRGGENVLAADYMLNVRGVDRFSFYAGSSMRNQRIERQWRDTNQRGVRPLLNMFKEMENAGVIQSDSELDLFILHQVATNLFQRTLETYVDSWNNHPIRTEGNKTPNQLYVSGSKDHVRKESCV